MSEELKSCPFCRAKINTERTFPVWECGNSMPICGEPEYLRSYRCMERQISMLESSTEVLVVNNESMMKRSENYMESKDRLQEAKDDLLSTRLHIREICKQLGIPYSGKDSLVDVEVEIGQLLHDKAELEKEILELRQDKLKVAGEQHENVKKFVDLATKDSELRLKESMDRETELEGLVVEELKGGWGMLKVAKSIIVLMVVIAAISASDKLNMGGVIDNPAPGNNVEQSVAPIYDYERESVGRYDSGRATVGTHSRFHASLDSNYVAMLYIDVERYLPAGCTKTFGDVGWGTYSSTSRDSIWAAE